MRHFLPELIAAPLLPLLMVQGKLARKRILRLPEAAGIAAGIASSIFGAPPLKLLAIGESPVAGVGVDTHQDAITAQLAVSLAQRLQRPIEWRAYGLNGATVRDAQQQILSTLPAQQVDVALVAFGVNDTTAFRSVAEWRTDMQLLLRSLEARCNPTMILLSGVPPMGKLAALPQPLRTVMGLKASVLEQALADFAKNSPHILHVALNLDVTDTSLLARDGYHPSVKGCEAWAAVLADRCEQHYHAAFTANGHAKARCLD